VSGEQSRWLTVRAELRGLVVYKETDASKSSHLVVTRSRDEPCDPHHLTPPQLKAFSDCCDVALDNPNTLIDDIAMYGIPLTTLTSFVDEVKRYGVAALKRRNIILEQEIVSEIQKQSKYKNLQERRVERVGALDPTGTIQRKIYIETNTNRLFFSIDLRSAIFNCYKQLGIITTNTWAEFVSQYTPSISFANNKPARLHIFGELDKQRTHIILWNNALWDGIDFF
jgi:hypothetical protein